MVLLASNRPDYAAAANAVQNLDVLVKAARGKTTVKTAAMNIGLSQQTLARLEAGAKPDRDTIVRVLLWLSRGGS